MSGLLLRVFVALSRSCRCLLFFVVLAYSIHRSHAPIASHQRATVDRVRMPDAMRTDSFRNPNVLGRFAASPSCGDYSDDARNTGVPHT